MADEGGEHNAAGQEGGQQGATGEGTATGSDQHWLDTLEEGALSEQDAGVLRRFKSVGDLARGYMNAFNLVGRDKIPMPKNDSEWEDTYNRLGRPEDPSKYDFKSFENNPDYPDALKENMRQNQEWFQLTAHKMGLSSKQADMLFNEYAGLINSRVQEQETATKERVDDTMNKLKIEYGDNFQANMVLADRAIEALGGEALAKSLDSTGARWEAPIIKALVKLGGMLTEEQTLDKGGQTTDAADDLDAKIAEIQTDPAYLNRNDPKHTVLVTRMQKLMAKKYPEKNQQGIIRLF